MIAAGAGRDLNPSWPVVAAASPAAAAVKAPLLLELCLPLSCRSKQLRPQVAQGHFSSSRDVVSSTHNLGEGRGGRQGRKHSTVNTQR